MSSPRSSFQATQWTVILAAAGDGSAAHRALATLCECYWDPLYAFGRRTGLSPEDTEDAVQGFFADLLERQAITRVDRAKGRFRSFLLASFKNFLSHERARLQAEKRGGKCTFIELDAHDAEQRYALEPADHLTPDKLYDRRWARVLLERAHQRLAQEYEGAGKGTLFSHLRPILGVSRAEMNYAEIGSQVGMSPGAVKVAAHRMRERHRTILREEVGATVDSPGEIDAELRHLIEAL